MEQPFGKYELVKRIASGGMAEVFLALERMTHGGERHVVIKRILPAHADDPDFVEFFNHEARLSLQLCHPNLVQTYEFGVTKEKDGEIQYLAMEYVRGQTLLSALRQASTRGRNLSLGTIVKIASDITAGLHHAHSARDPSGASLGLVHRDVSPHNVLVGYEGIAKLADFGVAKTSGQRFRTRTGVIKGKFAYLAPEQLRRGGKFDHRVDLFAVGIVLYEMLSRRPLFRGYDETDTLNRIVKAKIPPVRSLRPDCPEALERVVMRALERNPDRRYPTAAALLSELEDAAQKNALPASVSQVRDEMELLFPQAAEASMIPINLSDPEIAAVLGAADDEDAHDDDSEVASVLPDPEPLRASGPSRPQSPFGAALESTGPLDLGGSGSSGRRALPPAAAAAHDSTMEHFLRLASTTPAPADFAASPIGVRLVTATYQSPSGVTFPDSNASNASGASASSMNSVSSMSSAPSGLLASFVGGGTMPGAGAAAGFHSTPAPPSRYPAATPSIDRTPPGFAALPFASTSPGLAPRNVSPASTAAAANAAASAARSPSPSSYSGDALFGPASVPPPQPVARVLAALADPNGDAPLELDHPRNRPSRTTQTMARRPIALRERTSSGGNALLIVGLLAIAAVAALLVKTLFLS